MTEKRFTINFEDECIDDAKEEIFINFNDKIDFYQLCDLLNALHEENKKLKQINSNLGDFRNFITEQNVLNEKQRKELQLQMLRLYNYFENYFEDTMSPNAFGEMWDNVKEDKKWEKRW